MPFEAGTLAALLAISSDAATFLAAFAVIFGGLAAYLVHLDRIARRLSARLHSAEASAATEKKPDTEAGSRRP